VVVRPGSRSDAESVRLPARPVAPVVAITRRLLAALAILLAVVAVVLIGRSGYRDVTGDRIGVIDAFYYASVTLSTTGYGDITPVSSGARLVNVLIVTPARVLFLGIALLTAPLRPQPFDRPRPRGRGRDCCGPLPVRAALAAHGGTRRTQCVDEISHAC